MKTKAFAFVVLCLIYKVFASHIRVKSQRIDTDNAYDASMDTIILENTTVYNAVCDLPRGRERYCSLYIKTVSFGSDTDWEVCRFSIWTDSETSRIADVLQLFRFGEYKVLLSWLEYNPNSTVQVNHVNGKKIDAGVFVKFMTIRLPHCVMSDFQVKGAVYERNMSVLEYFKRSVYILLNDDTVDVIYSYNEDHEYVEESFDSEGVRIRGPVLKEDFVINEDAVTFPTYWKDRFQKCNVLWPQERFRLAPGYRLADLPEYLLNVNGTATGVLRGWSTSNGNVSFCKINMLNNNIWHCAQGETTDSLSLFKVRFNYVPRHSMIYNVPGGGLLTITSGSNATYFDLKHYFWVTLFRSDGFAYKPVLFMELQCRYSILLGNFFQDVNGDFCFAVIAYEYNPTLLVKCFPMETLTETVNANPAGESLRNLLSEIRVLPFFKH